MKPTNWIERPGFGLIGISTRTKNADETNPRTGKIGPLWGRFVQENIKEQIPGKTNAITLAVYSEYESNEKGMYSLTVGCESHHAGILPPAMVLRYVPTQRYAVIRTRRGPIPDVLFDAWQGIWKMSEKDLGGHRSFTFDFELYDQRAQDPKNAEVDIYLAIR
jgi:predicted transcriptional regulator YdeE